MTSYTVSDTEFMGWLKQVCNWYFGVK